MPVIEGLGSTEEFIPVTPPEVEELYKSGLPHFQAMVEHFSAAQMQEWVAKGLIVVNNIFNQMKDGETALVVGHSPFVEFAVWGSIGWFPKVCSNLKEMTGFELQEDKQRIILFKTFLPPS